MTTTPQMHSCPTCNYTVCTNCIETNCAPSRCVMCPGPKHRRRSYATLNTEAFFSALRGFNQGDPVPTKAAAFGNLLTAIENAKYVVLGIHQLRSTINYKMKIASEVSTKHWLHQYPGLVERAGKLYAFLRWGTVPSRTGVEFAVVTVPVAAAQ